MPMWSEWLKGLVQRHEIEDFVAGRIVHGQPEVGTPRLRGSGSESNMNVSPDLIWEVRKRVVFERKKE